MSLVRSLRTRLKVKHTRGTSPLGTSPTECIGFSPGRRSSPLSTLASTQRHVLGMHVWRGGEGQRQQGGGDVPREVRERAVLRQLGNETKTRDLGFTSRFMTL
eukprot:1193606-Prorocentrum_minimum.AAC.1